MIQDSLIKDKGTTSIEEARKLLEDSGVYRVEKITTENSKLTYSDLVSFFYDELEKKEGADFVLTTLSNREKDFSAIKKYVKKAKEHGWTRPKTTESLKTLLELVFQYYEELALDPAPSSLSFVLSASGSWIIRKAAALHKTKLKQYKYSKEFNDYLDSLCSIKTKEVEKYTKIRHNKLRKIYNTLTKGQ